MTKASVMVRVARRLRALRNLPRLRRTPLFDAGWYLETYDDLAGLVAHADVRNQAKRTARAAAMHYLVHGADEGRDPSAGFSTSGYRLQGWDETGNPLLHHLENPGAYAPLPVFDGTRPDVCVDAPVVLFCAHQALGQQFGAERSFLTMLERAGKAGLAVEVVLPHCHDAAYLAACRDRARAVRLIPYGWRRRGKVPHPTTVAALKAAIHDSGACEVHVNTLACDAPLAAARAVGVPGVVYLRELPQEDAELCARLGFDPDLLRTTLLEESDRFVANSAATAHWIDPGKQLEPGRLVTLPNRVDEALFDLPFAPQKPLRVALISSNIAKKGIADACRVARTALRLGLDVEVLLIGPASADLAALGPLPRNMRHAGYAEGPLQALALADVVLSLSHFAESFGRTVLEAMAAGRPVVSYDRGTPPVLIAGRGNDALPAAGHVVPAGDVDAVVQALEHLLATPEAMSAASAGGRARARAIQDEAAALEDAQLYANAYR
ncbi:glycosyltransferase family 4 protein [Pseudotabrizicola algicola]|uniref:Glycosyltransferase family 4 protein n=1 Tax=Pseudotabrizicola algicola TaxID=2709381 RepID=A0A6B3RU72_9RHOB|nr:glycosyltransferase family 4 protein [Pseudotabrizicola algicola]NEX46599.1 glycosyltransferase family 4 protein [Pseudotabrizicola algicola]